jgi:hypothetical protein
LHSVWTATLCRMTNSLTSDSNRTVTILCAETCAHLLHTRTDMLRSPPQQCLPHLISHSAATGELSKVFDCLCVCYCLQKLHKDINPEDCNCGVCCKRKSLVFNVC